DEWIVRMERLITRKRDWENVAMRDRLTEAYVKGYLPNCFEIMNSRLKETGETFCMAVLDLDYFKQVNDRFGHSTGDLVMQQLGKTVRQTIRSEDLFIRYGGEEFILLLAHTKIREASKRMEQL